MLEITASQLQIIVVNAGLVGALIGILLMGLLFIVMMYSYKKNVATFFKNLSDGKTKNELFAEMKLLQRTSQNLYEKTGRKYFRDLYNDILDIWNRYKKNIVD